MGVYIWNRLPSEYQEVEYIQSSGTQYINTGYQPSSNTEVEGKVNIQSFSSGNNYTIYGARNTDSGALRRAFAFQIDGDLAKFRATIYSNTGTYDKHIDSINTISTNTIYTFKQTQTNFYLNGTSQGTYSSSSYSVPYNMYIFAYNTGGSVGQQLSMRLYSLEIKDNGTLVRNFIPCYRKSDSVIGLYDLVNNQFYTNSGSGTFSKGSDVNTYRESSLKNAYIGEVYEYSYDFRGKTAAQVTAEGWTLGSGVSFDSNGAYSSSWSSSTKAIGYALSNAKRITMTAGIYNAISGNLSYMLWNNQNTSTNQTGYYMSGYDGGNSQILVNGTIIEQYAQSEPSGQSEYNYTLDFENLTYKFEYAGITKSGTITQAQATSIKNNLTYFRFAIQHNSRLQYIKLLVE